MRAITNPLSLSLGAVFCAVLSGSSVASQVSADAVTRIDAAQGAVDREDWASALPLLKQLVAQSPANGKFRLELAQAKLGAKDFAGAIADFKAARDLGAASTAYLAYQIATSYARSGHKVEALAWIKTAMAEGYRTLEEARSDADFAALKNDPEYRATLGILDPSKLSRDDGWRTDIHFLADWVEKKSFHPFRTTTSDRTLSGARLTKEEFEAAVAGLSSHVPTLSDGEIEVALFELIAQLGDGHTTLGGSRTRLEFAITLPLAFYDFDDGLYVVAAVPQYRQLIGAKILALDGMPIAEARAKVAPLIARDNAMWVRALLPHYLRHLPFLQTLGIAKSDKSLELTIVRGGATQKVEVQADPSAPDIWNALPKPAGWAWYADASQADFQRDNDKPHWLKWDEANHLIYVQYNGVVDGDHETLAGFAEALKAEIERRPVTKLVLDMRNNNGGNTYLNAPLHAVIAGSPKVNARGHLYVIIGRRTFSAAMNAVSYLARDTKAVFVGEATGGKANAPGDETFFTLPYSGMAVNLSDRYWQGGWPNDFSPWRAPDIAAPVLFSDYAAGRDAALEAIKIQRP